MNLSEQIAKHFREINFGGNWTTSNLRDNLADVTWQEATTKVNSFNTIATLVYHTNYFVSAIIPVLQGGQLNAHDKYSFNHLPIRSEQDWEQMLNKVWSDAETCANLVKDIPETMLWEDFTDAKYGSYYRNLHGVIEHTHYHLGQIVILKKLIREGK
jgi:hypothetical protein